MTIVLSTSYFLSPSFGLDLQGLTPAQKALAEWEKNCEEDEPCPEYDSSSSYDPYFGDIRTYQNGGRSRSRSRGKFWLNFNFGGGRSIGYINNNSGW